MNRLRMLMLLLFVAVTGAMGADVRERFVPDALPNAGAGRYRVTAAMADPDAVKALAAELAVTYRGRLEPYAESSGTGFIVVMRESYARAMSFDPRVVLVEELPQVAFAVQKSGPVQTHTASSWTTGAYQYDGSGNVKAIGDDLFTYDRLNRVTRGNAGPGRTESYTYDPFGNLRTITTEAVGFLPSVLRLGVDSATNRITVMTDPGSGTAYNARGTYDGSGNILSMTTPGVTRTFTYDALGVTTSSEFQSSEPRRKRYLYTASDERIATVDDPALDLPSVLWTLRDPQGKVLRRFGSLTLTTELFWEEDYVYGPGGRLLAAEEPRDATRTRRKQFHLDHLGTPRLVTVDGAVELSRHVYYPFGRDPRAGFTIADKHQFTGHERDDHQLDYMHARYYTPSLGRFLSVDPGRDWNLAEPQRWNLYTYARNTPVNATDPDGRQTRSDSPRKNCMDGGSGACAQAMKNFENPTFGELDRRFWRMQLQWTMFAFTVPALSLRALGMTAAIGAGVGVTEETTKGDPTPESVALAAADGAMNLTVTRAAQNGVKKVATGTDEDDSNIVDDAISAVFSVLLPNATSEFFLYDPNRDDPPPQTPPPAEKKQPELVVKKDDQGN